MVYLFDRARKRINQEYIKHNGKPCKYDLRNMGEYLDRNAVVYYNDDYVLKGKNEVLHIPQGWVNGYNNFTYNYGGRVNIRNG